MAGKSPYGVVLSEEQRRELERRAGAYSGPHRDVVRAKAILYAAEGMSNAEIAGRLDQSRQAVPGWRKRFCAEGVEGLEERPRPGRPRRFSPGAGGRSQGAGVRTAGRAGRIRELKPPALAAFDALVVHAQRLHRHRARPGRHLALPRTSVAHDQPLGVLSALIRGPLDVLTDLGLQRGRAHSGERPRARARPT